MIDLSKKYKTICGYEVKNLRYTADLNLSCPYPLVGEYMKNGQPILCFWTIFGEFTGKDILNDKDLVEVNDSNEKEAKDMKQTKAQDSTWKVGFVTLLDGSDGWIDFVQSDSKYYHYIGRAKDSDGIWKAIHWGESGQVPYTTPPYAKNLVPPPKKTVRVQRWININYDGTAITFRTKEGAEKNRSDDFMACLVIDEVVTEGDGL